MAGTSSSNFYCKDTLSVTRRADFGHQQRHHHGCRHRDDQRERGDQRLQRQREQPDLAERRFGGRQPEHERLADDGAEHRRWGDHGDTNKRARVPLRGTAAINAALATASYLANLTFDGADTLSVVTADPTGRSSGTRKAA
jgi:hypothetical protein